MEISWIKGFFIKICNAACDKRFEFKNNIYSHSLLKCWEDCGDNIVVFRSELNKNSDKCKSCKYLQNCYSTDCRVQSYSYTKSEKNSSPLAYFIAKTYKGDESE